MKLKTTLFTCFYSLSLVVSLVVTRCHSLSLVVPLVVTHCHSIYCSAFFFINDPDWTGNRKYVNDSNLIKIDNWKSNLNFEKDNFQFLFQFYWCQHLDERYINVHWTKLTKSLYKKSVCFPKWISRYTKLFSSTSHSDKPCAHWWIVLKVYPRYAIFFLGLFGVISLQSFIVKDNEKIVNKIPFGLQKFQQKYNKVTERETKFNMISYRDLSNSRKLKLSEIATNMFFFIHEFWRYNTKGNLKMSMVEGQNDYLIFQLHFYHNLSHSKEHSRRSEIKQKN